MTNTVNHISDEARYIKFNPTGTSFMAGVTNVQDALGALGEWSIAAEGLPVASETVQGIARLATTDEAIAGTNTTAIITPATMNAVVKKPNATESVVGMTRYSNYDQAKGGTDNESAMTPLKVRYVLDNLPATESRLGALKIASASLAAAGTNDNTIMTPLKVKQAILALTPSEADASETVKGVTKLATVAIAQAGTARQGMAISPYTFARAYGTASNAGTFKLAQDGEMTNLSSNQHAVTPWALGRNKASTSKFGVVKLVTSKSGVTNAALAANASVVSCGGDTMTGNLNMNSGGTIGINWSNEASVMYNNSNNTMTNKANAVNWVNSGNTVLMSMNTSGHITTRWDITAFSDERVKTNIENIASALDKVKQLNGVMYNRTDDESQKRHMGLIAQEVEKIIPEVVSTQKINGYDDFKSVSYSNLVALLIEAVKELSDKLDNKE